MSKQPARLACLTVATALLFGAMGEIPVLAAGPSPDERTSEMAPPPAAFIPAPPVPPPSLDRYRGDWRTIAPAEGQWLFAKGWAEFHLVGEEDRAPRFSMFCRDDGLLLALRTHQNPDPSPDPTGFVSVWTKYMIRNVRGIHNKGFNAVVLKAKDPLLDALIAETEVLGVEGGSSGYSVIAIDEGVTRYLEECRASLTGA